MRRSVLLILGVLAGAHAASTPAGAQGSSPDAQSQGLPPVGEAQTSPATGLTAAPPEAYLYVGWPNNGETVKSPFKVWFGLRNMGVAPAGVTKANTGHHHLLIDTDLPPLDQPIPNNQQHLHFGGGQTEVVVDLPPGKHTLQLLLGDAEHIPFNPPVMSKKITVMVKQPRATSARSVTLLEAASDAETVGEIATSAQQKPRLACISAAMERPEDGILTVYGLNDKYMPAQTELWLERLRELIHLHRAMAKRRITEPAKQHPAPSATGYGQPAAERGLGSVPALGRVVLTCSHQLLTSRNERISTLQVYAIRTVECRCRSTE